MTRTVSMVRRLAGVGLLVLMTGWGYPASADRHSAAVCRSWKVVPGPDVTNAQLNAVSGASHDDVWAVGYSYSDTGSLVEHWDGEAWTVVPDASPGGPLNGVAAISGDDVWAVGSSNKLVTEHWDGLQWTLVPSPSPGSYYYLYGVGASASDDVWAVGSYLAGDGVVHGLVEHWDGIEWTLFPDDRTQYGETFYGVAVLSPTDAWAVGLRGTSDPFAFQPIIEHWDGIRWSVSRSPAFPGNDNQLYDVAATSPDNAWAVGFQGSPSNIQPLIEHWDGTHWRRVQAGPVPGTGNFLFGVAAISLEDVWAVGESDAGSDYRPLTQHWDGSSWTLKRAPNPGLDASLVAAMAIRTEAWAVGAQFDDSGLKPLFERSRHSCPGRSQPGLALGRVSH